MTARDEAGVGVRIGRVRCSAVELLAALALLFVITPFVQDVPHGQAIDAALFTVVLVFGVLAIGARGRSLWIGGLLCAAALGARWTQHVSPQLLPVWVSPATALLFLVYVVLQLLRFVIRASRVNSEVLCAAISAYLLIGLIWALNYSLVARVSSDAFLFTAGSDATRKMDSFNAFYFSFVVLSTVGFGDIIPISRVARMLAVTEAITGLFYVTVLIARLVAMYVPSARKADASHSDPS